MTTVPISSAPKRKPLPVPDSKYLLMAMANMHNAGKIQVGPQPQSGADQSTPDVSAATESLK